MTTLRHKTFIGPTIYLQGGSLNENREAIRGHAEAFINAVGSENVLSVCEHAMSFGPFSVVVWYRGGAVPADGSDVVHVGNAAIGRALRTGCARWVARPGDDLAPEGRPASAGGGQGMGWWFWLFVLLIALVALAGFLQR